jgi:hypothetical protein
VKAYIKNKKHNFICGWYINKNVCKNLINLFNKNINKAQPGLVGHGYLPNLKKSIDLTCSRNSTEIEIQNYLKELKKCADEYIKTYPYVDTHLESWGIVENFNIQKYNPGDAFFGWHMERAGKKTHSINRVLTFMTYLNDVKDQGETEFFHQKLKIKPEEGLTLIWPVDWMFIHRGIPSKTEEKFITTGWYSFI